MRYFRALTISLIFHFMVMAVLYRVPPADFNGAKNLTYIDLVEDPELPRRPIQLPRDQKTFVRSVEVPPEIETNESRESRFSSEEERFVLQEQKARVNDLTSNRSSRELAAKPSQKTKKPGSAKDQPTTNQPTINQAEASQKELDLKPEANSNLSASEKQRRLVEKESRDGSKPLIFPDLGSSERGVSTLGEKLPDDIKFGDFTALNTDRHLYYTFYARIEEKIRHRWVNYARAAIYNLPAQALRSKGDDFATKLEIILDSKGHFVRAILHETSGVKSLDSAPVQAFRDAGQFPNPPVEMIKDDGTIRVFYSFNVSI